MNQQTFECDAEHAAQADEVYLLVGDCMSPTLTPGDALGVRRAALPELGDMVVVERGGKVCVNRWGGELAGQVGLISDNPTYAAGFVKAADLRVVGVVAWICRVREDGQREFRQPPRATRLPVFVLPAERVAGRRRSLPGGSGRDGTQRRALTTRAVRRGKRAPAASGAPRHDSPGGSNPGNRAEIRVAARVASRDRRRIRALDLGRVAGREGIALSVFDEAG